MPRFPWPSKWTLLGESVMVSISPVPKTPVPVLYFHADRSTPLPTAPSKVSVQTFVHPAPPGRPGPSACPAGEAAACDIATATAQATTTATAPIRPCVSLIIATTPYRCTSCRHNSRRRPRTGPPGSSCAKSGLPALSREVDGGREQLELYTD